MVPTLDDSLVNRVIADKFRLRACIGAGASGAVYQADQIALGRTVAVKILRPELAEDPRIVNRFHDEALAASRLNHPNTVSIIDYGQTSDGLLYLVMEFLRGQTLTQVLQQRFPLPPEWIAEVVGQVLAGLEEAHASGVVHADLKCDNIVAEQRREGWQLVKVVDFGVARIVGVSEHDQRTICGTPEYMAPEVISGGEPTFASDLYAVGVVLYELLAGVTPFATGSVMEVLNRHLEETPAPPSAKHPTLTIHAGLEAIALRALAKDPRQRFLDAAAFRTALADAVGKRRQPAADQVLCPSCGVLVTAAFKFCPECGSPRAELVAPARPEPLTAPPDEFDDD
ncbi:MAG TPA: serine/threonine-protein kinase, partial [Kofleriaceae bacterium]|nr:serine/threonine-protein kinase [Kofleriaceae bacterium]